MLATLVTLAVSTFASEDLACVAAGTLIARGDLSATAGVAACALGIFVGDLALWMIGRLGGHALEASSWIAKRLPSTRLDQCRQWLDGHAGRAIIASRFTPGTRLPLYLTAGVVRMSPWRFAAWTFAAVMLWTPAVVLGGSRIGRTIAPVTPWSTLAAAAAMLVVVRTAATLASPSRRNEFGAALRRYARWEFWPAWLFYAPVVAHVFLLAIRYRSLTVMTSSNPGIPDGGFVGESKFEILRRLPREWTIPSAYLAPAAGADPERHALAIMAREGWAFPVVLKPDVGQRGEGVQLVRSQELLADYVASARGAVLMQPYHAGPYEAGVFYYRHPGEPTGRIFSITDKRFPVVVGDGHRTLTELIDAHPRYRLQRRIFLQRHRHLTDVVLARGETFPLTIAGNHAQGTTFCDGAHLWTPELEARIDAIAHQYPGFFIGRFDVRYQDVEAFKAGRDLAIVELNGATSESTNIYDPGNTLFGAYRTLFRQWALVFAIGAANRARGAQTTPLSLFVRLIGAHLAASSYA